jgi:drug/metabolite transporter (DMT)-like permease
VSIAVVIGLVLALATAFTSNAGYLMKHRGALAAPDVDIRRPLRTAVDLFRSKWWAIGFAVAILAWLLHVGAVGLAPLSLAQAVTAGGLVLLGVLAERWFGFDLQRRQWLGVALVAVGMASLALTTPDVGEHSSYRLAGMIAFQGALVALGIGLVMCCRVPRWGEHHGVFLGAAAGILIGVSDVSIKALTGTVSDDLLAILSPWTLCAVLAGVAAFYASARSLQIGEGIAVITATSAAANLSTIVGGVLVFGDSLGETPLLVVLRLFAFALIIVSVSLMPAPTRAAQSVAAN